MRTLLNARQSVHLHSDDWHRTIYIDTLDVGTTDFDIGDAKKKKLVDEGQKGLERYFEWYDPAPGGGVRVEPAGAREPARGAPVPCGPARISARWRSR